MSSIDAHSRMTGHLVSWRKRVLRMKNKTNIKPFGAIVPSSINNINT
jgi:hypothetical protein